eukprot:m.74815 g.74815  ORF g.74815 m.74815 type:complete len:613 (+) comp12481_c0_seq2:179-2017(+)
MTFGKFILSVLSLAGVSTVTKAECDFRALASCISPAGGTTSVICKIYGTYLDCATNADCLRETSVQRIVTTHRKTCGAILTESPALYTEAGNVHVHGKSVCFKENGVETCVKDILDDISGLELAIDTVNISVTETQEMVKVKIAESINEIQMELQNETQSRKLLESVVSAQGKDIEELQNVNCGRSCYGGEYMKQPCSPSQRIVCEKCTTGTYSLGGLPSACETCSQCGTAQYVASECALSSNTVCADCKPCPSGSYASGPCGGSNDLTHCKAHKKCADDEYESVKGNALRDTVCSACKTCSAGFYAKKTCTIDSNTECEKCSTCPSTQYPTNVCTATTNLKCAVPTSCAEVGEHETKNGEYTLTIGKVYCVLNEGDGGWTLGMNIHPSDGHSAAWAAKLTGFVQNGYNQVNRDTPRWWLGNIAYAPNGIGKPFGKDYKNKDVWGKFKVSEIMIMRHANGVAHMWKYWKVNNVWKERTMLDIFNRAYRSIITETSHTKVDLKGKSGSTVSRDPVFRYGGGLLFNWYYSNNGARIALSGQSLSGETLNDDSTFGLGMEFASYQGYRRLSGSEGSWCFDVSFAECPSSSCAQGRDHCRSLNDGIVLGEYAILVR